MAAGDATDASAVTVVVPTRDRPELLAQCLDALLATDPRPAEVVVVDSASRDPAAVAPAVARGVRVLRCEEPGASLARNVGWRAARTPLVAFVDDDVRVDPAWVAGIAAPFEQPDVALVTGAVTGGGTATDRAVATTGDVAGGRFGLGDLGNVGASANLAVRRDALDAVGGFDEVLGAGARFRAAEDLDLFDRVLVRGGGWHATAAVAVHEQWRGRPELLRLEFAYGIGFGARLAKLVRTDRGRARVLAGYEVRRLGRDLLGDLRKRYEFGILSRLWWTCGVLAGLVRALRWPIRDGRFVHR